MLNVELPDGLKGASLNQHSTLNIQHSIFRHRRRHHRLCRCLECRCPLCRYQPMSRHLQKE
nr:MAG TPA: hypothetical protein [Caudoviricetes sp.]